MQRAAMLSLLALALAPQAAQGLIVATKAQGPLDNAIFDDHPQPVIVNLNLKLNLQPPRENERAPHESAPYNKNALGEMLSKASLPGDLANNLMSLNKDLSAFKGGNAAQMQAFVAQQVQKAIKEVQADPAYKRQIGMAEASGGAGCPSAEELNRASLLDNVKKLADLCATGSPLPEELKQLFRDREKLMTLAREKDLPTCVKKQLHTIIETRLMKLGVVVDHAKQTVPRNVVVQLQGIPLVAPGTNGR